ncbi:hypothetical protein DFH06DRAFT_1210550 [Mycena polygramma]|nr:hypothetical protein DFH06DRAFT_1210550 [Mycena polygramma]
MQSTELEQRYGFETSRITEDPEVFIPHYGVVAVTWQLINMDGSQIPLIYFWPGRVTGSDLTFGPGYVYRHPHYIHHIKVGGSGAYALLWVWDEEQGSSLELLHISATPAPHTTFRKLDLDDVTLSDGCLIELDDSLGLVFVWNSEGMKVISYS